MIVASDTPASPTKSNDQVGSPPAYQYNGYSSVPSSSRRPMPPPSATQTTPILVKPPQDRPGSKACKRFAKAFFVAMLIYLLAAAFFGSWTWGRNFKDGDWQYWGDSDPDWPNYTGGIGSWKIAQNGCSAPWDDGENLLASGVISLPDMNISIPDIPDIDIGAPGNIEFNSPYHSHTSLTMSPEAVKHLIVGNRAYGNIQFAATSDSQIKDIKVDITAYYHRQYIFEKVRICKLSTKDGGEGVGLYMPTHRGPLHREDNVSFKVMITFPTSRSRKEPVVINSFETSLSIFSHQLHELRGKIYFRDLKLRSSNALLKADSVEAAQADLRTSNGGISGRFFVNNSLVLDTSNGRIDVELELEDEGSSNGVDVTLKSSNAAILANTNLYAQLDNINNSPYKSDKGGRFSIDAKTSNGHLTLNVPTIPYEAKLRLSGKSSNAPIDVQLDRKGSFEGTYRADTSSYMGAPVVERADDRGRTGHRRVMEPSFGGKGTMAGKIYWDDWGKGREGSVEAKTSNAKIYLSI